jgi:enoyl-[acyl-carrier protein] reductase / trans-2-enoyl-CoA reductase (NAD+)
MIEYSLIVKVFYKGVYTMIVEPNVRGFICTTAHPLGCMENVKRQIAYTKEKGKISGPKKVLIIGSSTGYGLASRITATYAGEAATIGIMFDRPATDRRTATPGFYNTAAFETLARKDGYYAKSINGDAFSKNIKEQTIDLIKKDLGKVDMVIYSLASPRRTTEDGVTYQSCLKTTSSDFTNKSLNLRNNTITQATITPANEEEITATIKVMGGEDWKDWITALWNAGVLEENATTLAYSYIGPKLTYPVYYNGTIGMAKKHLYDTSLAITNEFKEGNIKAYISVNKALVTQASSAIPIVPLYFAILYSVMKEKGTHEGCIEQTNRLFHEKFIAGNPIMDKTGQIRLDDYEMEEDVQAEVIRRWNQVNTENVDKLADLDGYWEDFYHMFGFHFNNVDYTTDVEI